MALRKFRGAIFCIVVKSAESEGEELVDFLNESLAFLRACQTDGCFLPVLEEEEGGDRHDAVLGAEVRLLVDVVFADDYFAFVFPGKFVDDGRHAYAGAAPCGPEIDYYGLARTDDFLSVSVSDSKCH